MHKMMIGFGAAVGLFALCSGSTLAKDTYGWIEMMGLPALDIETKAKLDTGALTSSMQAEDIELFEKDDEDWVRFTLELEDQKTGEEVTKRLELPVYRDLTVIGAGGRDHRPVVLMKVCFGDQLYERQFSLEDRDNLNYPVLIGRRLIQHLGPIDVTRTFINDPDCDEDSELLTYEEQENDEDIGI